MGDFLEWYFLISIFVIGYLYSTNWDLKRWVKQGDENLKRIGFREDYLIKTISESSILRLNDKINLLRHYMRECNDKKIDNLHLTTPKWDPKRYRVEIGRGGSGGRLIITRTFPNDRDYRYIDYDELDYRVEEEMDKFIGYD